MRIFSKIKPTEGLLFKRQNNRLEMTDDTLKISTFPFFVFSGDYDIIGVVQNSEVAIVYHIINNELPEDRFIYISKVNNRVMVYNNRKEGVILK